jgi:hypothetical protein
MAVIGVFWIYIGAFWLHVFLRHGGDYWVTVGMDSPRLSPSMRIALHGGTGATPGEYHWREVSAGFEVAELPAVVSGQEVDSITMEMPASGSRIEASWGRIRTDELSLERPKTPIFRYTVLPGFCMTRGLG